MMNMILRIAVPLVLLAAGIGGLVLFGRRDPPESRADTDQDTRPLVATTAVTRHDGGLDITTDGIVVPFREIKLAAEVAGNVVFKSPQCNEGNYVTAGTKLIEIDPRDYELEERRLLAELNQARTSVSELNVELENAQQMVPLAQRELALRKSQKDRIESLRASRLVSQEQYEDAERDEISARNALLTAEQKRDSLKTRKARFESAIDVGQVQLEKAQLAVKRTVITAPVSGVIIQDDVEQDSYVQPGAMLLTMEDTSQVEVLCSLRMDEMRWIWQQPVPEDSTTAEVNASPVGNYRLPPTDVTVRYKLVDTVYSWNGVLARYDGLGLDERTRMIPCRVVVDKPQDITTGGKAVTARGPRSLVRGMYVNLIIHTRPSTTLLRVPESAIQPGRVVWVVRDGKLIRVALQIAEVDGDAMLVDAEGSDLHIGDRLVVSPLQTPFTGLEVREETGS